MAALEQSGLVLWLNELDWLRFHNLRQPLNVRDVNQQILNFVTSIITAFLSLATFVRPAGDIGLEEVH